MNGAIGTSPCLKKAKVAIKLKSFSTITGAISPSNPKPAPSNVEFQFTTCM